MKAKYARQIREGIHMGRLYRTMRDRGYDELAAWFISKTSGGTDLYIRAVDRTLKKAGFYVDTF